MRRSRRASALLPRLPPCSRGFAAGRALRALGCAAGRALRALGCAAWHRLPPHRFPTQKTAPETRSGHICFSFSGYQTAVVASST